MREWREVQDQRKARRGREPWGGMTTALRSLALVLAGAAAALIGRSLLISGPESRADLLDELSRLQGEQMAQISSFAEERAQTTRDLALAQFYRLQDFRQFGAEGQALVWLVPTEAGAEGDLLRAAAGGAAVRLPRLAVDASARSTWNQVADRLTSLEGTVDARIFDSFRAVQAFAVEHPWPPGTGLEAARRSDWVRPEVIEGWLSLNRALVSRVDGLLSGF